GDTRANSFAAPLAAEIKAGNRWTARSALIVNCYGSQFALAEVEKGLGHNHLDHANIESLVEEVARELAVAQGFERSEVECILADIDAADHRPTSFAADFDFDTLGKHLLIENERRAERDTAKRNVQK